MEIKTVKSSLMEPITINSLAKEMAIIIKRCNDIRNKIEDKYIEDTHIETGISDIADKNLVIFLCVKYGVDLKRPLDIGHFRLNTSSKRLISHNKKSTFNVREFIAELDKTKSEKLKLVRDDCIKYLKVYDELEQDFEDCEVSLVIGDLTYTLEYSTNIKDYDEDNRNDFECKVKVANKKGDELAEFTMEIRYKSVEYNINISHPKAEHINDEEFKSIVTQLYGMIENKLRKTKEVFDNQLKLLNEFSLV